MHFKHYHLGCLAQTSYLVGDAGRAVIIDPRRDVDEYIADARAAGLQIVAVLETHNHADFVSGHLELARRTGATIHVGAGAQASYPHRALHDGDRIELGRYAIVALATPGHTPESMTFLLVDARDGDRPLKAFTGDTLFVGDVGRPDLLGAQGRTPAEMARALYRSLHGKLAVLPGDVEVWPAHGAGSLCGKALGAEPFSTIAAQRAGNPALLCPDEASFVEYVTHGQPPPPDYFAHEVATNRAGARPVAEVVAAVPSLAPRRAARLVARGALVLDVRDPEAFAAGHVPGALFVGLDGSFAPWVGAMLDAQAPLVLVAPPGREQEAIVRLARIGYESVRAVVEGGFGAWAAAGLPVARIERVAPGALDALEPDARVVDVRTPAEWERGHLPRAESLPLLDLPGRAFELEDARPLVLHCAAGYRSMIAASVLARLGVTARDVRGGYQAIVAAGAPRPVSP